MRLCLAMLLAAAAAGCLEVEEEFTLNPDGSGKVTVALVFTPGGGLRMGGEETDPEEQMKEAVCQELAQSEGVDCWKDVTYELRDDGRVSFKGTAYFKDIRTLKLHQQGIATDLTRPAFSTDEKGNIEIRVGTQSGEKKEEAASEEELTEEEIAKRVREQRFKYQQSKPMLQGVMSSLRVKVTLNLPGPIAESSGFKKASDSSVSHLLDGKETFRWLDEAILDDARFRKAVEGGFKMNAEGNSQIPGVELLGAEPLRVLTGGPMKPLFDYEKEVTAEVRGAYEKLRADLGVQAGEEPEVDEVPFPPNREEGGDTPDMAALLRKHFAIDLCGTDILVCRDFDDGVTERLCNSAGEADYACDIDGPRGSYSRSGSDDPNRLRLVWERKDAIARAPLFELQMGPRRLTVSQSPEQQRVLIEDGERLAVFIRRPNGITQLALVLSDGRFAGAWSSLDEAFRREPAELAPFLSLFQWLPIPLAPTPSSADVIDISLRWDEQPDGDFRALAARLRDQLSEDDPVVREDAAGALGTAMGNDPLRVRHVLGLLEKTDEAEARSRMEQAVRDRGPVAEAVRLASTRKLYRDVEYLGSLLGSRDPAQAAAARKRLQALVGVPFDGREAFQSWYSANGGRLSWDEAAGKYTIR